MGIIAGSADLRCRERAALPEVVPLEAPFLLGIEPTNHCNLRCAFCPTSDPELLRRVGRENGVMPIELFRRVVDGARSFREKIKEVCLFKDGEPLIHPHLPEMVAYLKQADICHTIKIFTNGLLLTPELGSRLVAAGADFIRISVEAVEAEGYEKLCGTRIDYRRLLDNVAALYRGRGACRVVAKILDVRLTDADKQRFYDDFSPITDLCAVDDLHGWTRSDTRDFSLGLHPDTHAGVKVRDKAVCPYPFYSLCVNCLGVVTVGCCDWSLQTRVGDAREASVRDIWHGKNLFDFRMMHLRHRRRENPACASCSHMRINPDNVDGHEEAMIAALLRQRAELGD